MMHCIPHPHVLLSSTPPLIHSYFLARSDLCSSATAAAGAPGGGAATATAAGVPGGRQEGRQRGERGGRDPPDGAAPEHPAPLVERVLRLRQVPGAAHRRRRVLQVGERPRLAGEEVGQAPPACIYMVI